MTKPRVMIVEDEVIVASNLEDRLKGLGYAVAAIAMSGKEAIEQATQARPDLVLMDIRLPGEMDGVEAGEAISARFDIPVVYLTGYSDDTTLQRAKVTEPYGYLLKPFRESELYSTIEMALYKHAMEKRLRESEARYRMVSELVSDFAYSVRVAPDGTLELEWATEALARISGLLLEEIQTRARADWASLIHPDDMPKVLDSVQDVLSGQSVDRELRVVTESGEVRWLRASARPIMDKTTDRVIHIIGAARDITERMQMLERLRKLSRAVEQGPSTVVITDHRGNIEYANPEFTRVTGYTTQEVLGQNPRLLKSGQHAAAFYTQLWDTILAGQEWRGELVNKTKDGELYWELASIAPIRDAEGKITHFVKVAQDITERVLAEAALRKSEKQYRQLIELAQEGVWAIDAEAQTTFVNPRMAELLGYSLEEMQGRHLFSFMDERGVEIAKRNLERRQQGISEQHDFEFLRKDGTRIYTSLETSPITDDNGNYVGALALVADITERRRAEEALRRAYDELEIRVEERTAALQQANKALQNEIAERKQAEEELRSSEERFRQLAENIHETFWITSADEGQFIYVSPAYERMWKRSSETLFQKPESFIDTIHPDDREQVIASLVTQFQHKTDESYRIVRPDGSLRWIRARTFPIRNQLDQVYRVAGIAEDITEQMQAYHMLEQRVQERTRELSKLLEISNHVALTLELEPLLNLILDHLKAVVDYDDATIFKLDQEVLTILVHRGTIPREEIIQLSASWKDSLLVRQVIQNQDTIIIPDVQGNTPAARDFQDMLGEQIKTHFDRIHSWMGVPLTIKDQVMGILTVQHSEPERFAPDQADLALAFANQAAVAIENTRLYQQAQELAALEERQRLARDLHDAVSQTLFSASLAAEVLPRLWERNPIEGRRCLKEIQQLTRGALAEMRTLLLELRPSGLLEVGLGDLLRQLVEAASCRAQLPIDLNVEGKCSLSPDVQVNLYRIAQEGLSNIVKHAGATRAAVSLRCEPSLPSKSESEQTERLELRINDDGRGFNPEHVPAECLGLCIMRERAEAIGAAIKIESQIRYGTHLAVGWPSEQ